jgi:hypothetical protein
LAAWVRKGFLIPVRLAICFLKSSSFIVCVGWLPVVRAVGSVAGVFLCVINVYSWFMPFNGVFWGKSILWLIGGYSFGVRRFTLFLVVLVKACLILELFWVG